MTTHRKIYDEFLEEQVKIIPSLNDTLNLKKFEYLKNRLENPFSDYQEKLELTLYKNFLEDVNKIPKSNQNIYDKFLKHICEVSVEETKYNFSLIPITPLENDIGYMVENAAGNGSYVFDTKKSYDIFLEKMTIFPEICFSVVTKMREGIKKNYVLPKIVATQLLDQLTSLLKNKSYHNKSATKSFNKTIEELMVPEIQRLCDFLKSEYIPACRKTIGWSDLPNGRKEYEFLVKNTITQSGISIDSIHKFGLLEVERIKSQMESIMEQMEFKGTRKEFFLYIRNRKDLQFKSRNEMLKEYREMFKHIEKNIMPRLFSKKIKSKCEILRVPEYNEEYSPEAYYMEGDTNGDRPGRFYINMRNIAQNSKIEIESLTLHETLPGHHYQLSLVNESNKLPEFVKLYGIEAYLEGWGLYCENLGEYETAESYFGKLVLEMIRAIRLVVDTGIHYYGWSYKKCFNFFKKYGFDTDEQIDTQLIRYICIPSQALAYKMGEKCLIECLQKFHKDGGEDIKDFHNMILEDGAIPLYLLREKFGLK